jgi:hypothetical protein
MSRDTIFISHAILPKDNEFVLWLSSRLQVMGYKVWCDLIKLKGGEEDYWGKVIDPEIRNNAIKFILIVSKAGIVRQGVIDEYSFAREIAKEHALKDFVIPIRIEDVPFSSRIGLNTYNFIDCAENWQKAYKSLIERFESDNVPKFEDNKINTVYRNIIFSNKQVYPKQEYYYSSWLKPFNLPTSFFIFRYETEAQAKAIVKNYLFDYPIIRHGSLLISFQNEIELIVPKSTLEFDFAPANLSPIGIKEVNFNQVSDDDSQFPTLNDAHYLLKRLINQSFGLLLLKRGVKTHKMSNNRFCYYFPLHYHENNRAIVNYPNRVKKKKLVGKYLDGYWHFGISFNTIIKSSIYINIKSHILFSNDGKEIWKSESKLHTARRKKGRTWFNEEWRDQMMAFFAYLKKHDESTFLLYPLSNHSHLSMPLLTESYLSSFGYDEPITKDRLDIINPEEIITEYTDEINVA